MEYKFGEYIIEESEELWWWTFRDGHVHGGPCYRTSPETIALGEDLERIATPLKEWEARIGRRQNYTGAAYLVIPMAGGRRVLRKDGEDITEEMKGRMRSEHNVIV